ncbi:hypothetical protein Sjap_024490 [Stephania japonica]|uniref:UDP-N-acetylmuramate dehydrogenase n=1 Tax=Stephania japonica TaxID=461633 RepID=A0AAP0EKP6_9MAGN
MGFDGCVILNRIDFVENTDGEQLGDCYYRVGSGCPFNRFGIQSCIDGFGGLEFAAGIPGTVGGAVYMNAGADGQETSDTVNSVEIVTIDGERRVFDRNNLAFGYRWSCFQEMEDLAAIVSVTFRLKASSLSRARQQDYMARRRLLQPVGERSAGSVFRNPSGVGFSAGELIEKAGMKGFRVGGAKVSDKHANFFINSGSSTSRDMLELIHIVKEKVNQKFGIQLVEEIRYISPYHQSPR